MVIRPLTSDLKKRAEAEVNETPERLQNDLLHLKQWMAKQHHLPYISDEQFYVTFLRGCKYSLEKTKKKIDMYFSVRTAAPEFLSGRDPSDPFVRYNLKEGYSVPLTDLAPNGQRVLVCRVNRKDSSKFSFIDACKLWYLNMDLLMKEDDNFVINGMIQVIDMDCFTLGHMKQFTPVAFKKAITLLQDVFPTRVKGMHFINPPAIIDTFLSLILPFFSEKLRKRVLVHHKGSNTFYEHIPKEILPKEYNGTKEPLDHTIEKWIMKLDAQRSQIIKDEELKSDESKRQGKPRTQDDLFGVEGSFRKLIID